MIDSRSDEERLIDSKVAEAQAKPEAQLEDLGELNLRNSVADPTVDISETFPGDNALSQARKGKMTELTRNPNAKIEIVKIAGGSAWRVDNPFVHDQHPHRMAFTRSKERAKQVKIIMQKLYGPKLLHSNNSNAGTLGYNWQAGADGAPTKMAIVMALYQDNLTTKQISEQTGIRYQMVYNYIKKAGYEPHTKEKQ
jgi:hypothetical protein